MNTFVLTVLGGVIIFVVGQIILKFFIEPAQELKKILSLTHHSLLVHRAAITNAASDTEISLELKSRSAEILSKSNMIPCYGIVQIIFGLTSKSNVQMASRELISISQRMRPEVKAFQDSSGYNAPKQDFAVLNSEAIEKIEKLLKFVNFAKQAN